MRLLRQGLGTGLLLMMAAATASAEISLRLSNQQLTNQANVIVGSSCVGLRQQVIGRTLVTAVTIQVTESRKGAVGDRIEGPARWRRCEPTRAGRDDLRGRAADAEWRRRLPFLDL